MARFEVAPLRVRELKHHLLIFCQYRTEVAPLRVRELKQVKA